MHVEDVVPADGRRIGTAGTLRGDQGIDVEVLGRDPEDFLVPAEAAADAHDPELIVSGGQSHVFAFEFTAADLAAPRADELAKKPLLT